MDYEVIRSARKTVALQIKNGRLLVRAPLTATDAEIRALICREQKWIEQHWKQAQERQRAASSCPKLTEAELAELSAQARRVIPGRVAYYAAALGVSYGRITVRCQRTRWGSCSGRGDLNFNCLLMLAPPAVLDSVVVHELCHRKCMDHSSAFYAEVLRVFPDYYACRDWLKQNGAGLLARVDR